MNAISGNSDRFICTIVLAADQNWKRAGWLRRCRIWLLAPREEFTHLGMRLVIGWYAGTPYLVSIREVV